MSPALRALCCRSSVSVLAACQVLNLLAVHLPSLSFCFSCKRLAIAFTSFVVVYDFDGVPFASVYNLVSRRK